MAKIAILSVGITGRVHASCEIARRLSALGHTLVLASTDPRAGTRLAGTALPFHLLQDGVPGTLREQMKRKPRGAALRRLRCVIAEAKGRSALAGHGIDAFVAAHEPDLLLVESELHDHVLYLHRGHVPVVLLEYHLSVHRHAGIPPLSSTLIPDGALGALRAAAAWRWTMLKRRARQHLDRWYLRGWDARSVWMRLAQAGGTRLHAIAREDQWPILLYPGLPCINLCAPELDFPAAANDGRTFAGPVIQRRRIDAPGDEESGLCRQWLSSRDRSRPLVVCATGSILTLPAFVRKMLRVAAGGNFDLLIAAGRGMDPARLGDVPANVRVFRFIPQLEALEHAALFVCHGGIASIHESLLAGVPLLVCSGGCMDENGNAARVAALGLGSRGDMRRDDARALRRRIDALLGDEATRRAVRRMRDVLGRYEQEQCLESLVENHLAAAPLTGSFSAPDRAREGAPTGGDSP